MYQGLVVSIQYVNTCITNVSSRGNINFVCPDEKKISVTIKSEGRNICLLIYRHKCVYHIYKI